MNGCVFKAAHRLAKWALYNTGLSGVPTHFEAVFCCSVQ